MRLLVTRPEPDATRTAAALAALGHESLLAPLLEATFLPAPVMQHRPAAILFTSANAVRAVAAWPADLLPRALPVLVVGDHTAEAARAAGFSDTRSATGDGAALADLAVATLRPGAGPLFYPTVAAPARDLGGLLAAAGFTVDQVEAYRMEAARRLPDGVAAALSRGSLDGVLLYSRRSAAIFADLVVAEKPHLAALQVYCLSAEVAGGVDFGRVAIAAAPTEASLLALIGAGTSAAGIR